MFPPGRKKAPGYDGRNLGVMAKKRGNSKLDEQIDDNLRRVYSSTVNEPLPDRFAKLLDELRERERGETGTSGEEDN